MPAPGANTSMKNFGTEGKWRVQEYVYFVDRLKTRHWDSSTVIIDYDCVEFRLSTHSIGGISELDFELAKFIQETFNELFV